MINFHTITKGAKAVIMDAAYFNDYIVEIGAPLNVDSAIKWIGIYRDRVTYEPYTLQRNTWKALISLRIVIQDVKYDHSDMEEKLEEKLEALMNAIDAGNRNLNNTVDKIVGYDIEYSFVDNETSSFYFQTAVVTIQAEKVDT